VDPILGVPFGDLGIKVLMTEEGKPSTAKPNNSVLERHLPRQLHMSPVSRLKIEIRIMIGDDRVLIAYSMLTRVTCRWYDGRVADSGHGKRL
jgi:hypothetical protein